MSDIPPIPNLEDLADPDDIAATLKIAKSTLMAFRFKDPTLPYIRFGNTIYFSKVQVAWWLNQYQVASMRRFNDRRMVQTKRIREITASRKGK